MALLSFFVSSVSDMAEVEKNTKLRLRRQTDNPNTCWIYNIMVTSVPRVKIDCQMSNGFFRQVHLFCDCKLVWFTKISQRFDKRSLLRIANIWNLISEYLKQMYIMQLILVNMKLQRVLFPQHWCLINTRSIFQTNITFWGRSYAFKLIVSRVCGSSASWGFSADVNLNRTSLKSRTLDLGSQFRITIVSLTLTSTTVVGKRIIGPTNFVWSLCAAKLHDSKNLPHNLS